MDQDILRTLLEELRNGRLGVEDCLERLKGLPFENLDFACIDHHRSLRNGASEVIFGENKLVADIAAIMERMISHMENILVTRLSRDKAAELLSAFPKGIYHERAKVFTYESVEKRKKGKGVILVVSAGTSDMPVAEEARLTAEFLGNETESIYDVGVSGLHRLLSYRKKIMNASVIIVVAGMEGALPSVVGGLVERPVIAVPTSVGYGASLNGLAALLGMLNSCASGVTVVNIDNGFGAGYAASLINRL